MDNDIIGIYVVSIIALFACIFTFIVPETIKKIKNAKEIKKARTHLDEYLGI